MMKMTRRQVVTAVGAVGLGLVAGCGRWPWVAQPGARQLPIVYRVGILSSANVSGEEPVRNALRDLGYVEGENLRLETRLQLDPGEAGPQARELAQLGVDVIVTYTTTQARAASEATSTIPIVNIGVVGDDLVDAGLAESLARPGRNVTGLTTFESGLVGKRLQLLTEVAPGISRVAALWAGDGDAFPREHYAGAAGLLGVQLQVLEPRDKDEVERAFEAMSREHADAATIRSSPLVHQARARIAELALQKRLPTIGDSPTLTDDGLLMAYTARRSALMRRATDYVDRILKGTKPADLPIEQPMSFDFVINLRTAHALGLTIPPHVLLQATEVIQ